MEKGDILVASFPRSGSTWFRTIIANCLNLKDGAENHTQLKDLEKRMPVLGFSNLGRGGPEFYRPRLIKTHRLAGEIMPFRPNQSMHLWREPFGVMKSCFRYYSAHRDHDIESISTLIRNPRLGMPAWKKHYLAWSPVASVELEYNNMRDNTAGEISRVLSELGCDDLVPFVAGAVELASLENMKKSEKLGLRDPDRFARNFDTIGGGDADKSELSESDLEYIASFMQDVAVSS